MNARLPASPVGAWPFAEGEMACRIRGHDWGATKLGPTAGWSERLKVMVEQVLVSPVVSSLVCGPERLLIYNDAAAQLYGKRHPDALGQPLPESFPEGWATVGPLYDRVFAGETVQVNGRPLDLAGAGPGSAVFDAVVVPIRDERGKIAVAHMTGQEVGARIRAEKQQAFLLELSDALRPLTDVGEIERQATCLLGEHLQADRCFLSPVYDDGTGMCVREEYLRSGASSVLGDYTFAQFGDFVGPELKAGRILAVDDVAALGGLSAAERASYADVEIGAYLLVPLVRDGRLAAFLTVNHRTPRAWSDADKAVARQTADRLWTAREWGRTEAALRESEELRRVALAGGRMGAWRWDLDARLVWGDAQFMSIYGLPPTDDAVPLAVFTERMSAESAAEIEVIVTRAIAAGEEFDGPIQIATGPTAGRWVQWRGRTAGGKVSVLQGVSFDITEQKQAEVMLRESEERFRALVTAGAFSIFRMSPDWRLMYQLKSDSLADTNEPIEDWVGKYILDEDLPTVRAAVEEAIRAKSLFELEHRVLLADGSIGWVMSRAVPLLDANGDIVEWFGAGSDVTPRKQAEDALRDSEERLRQFGEASSDVLWIRDAETFQWTYLTPAFEAIYGIDRATALSGDNMAGWLHLIEPEDRDRAVESLRQVGDGRRVSFEYRIRRPSDGAVRWLRNTDFPMRDPAGSVRWIGGIGRDVTDEKATADRMGVLLGELQHRVRNTLAVIRSIARRTAASSETVEDYAMELDGRLNAFARVQAAVTRNPSAGIDLEYLIADELHVHTARDDRQVRIAGPPVRLQPKAAETLGLAVHELTTNAVKHGALATDHGSIRISWRQDGVGADARLVLTWKEKGVTVGNREPERRGFGMDLLVRTLAYELKARAEHVIEPDGLRYTVELPLSDKVVMAGTTSAVAG